MAFVCKYRSLDEDSLGGHGGRGGLLFGNVFTLYAAIRSGIGLDLAGTFLGEEHERC